MVPQQGAVGIGTALNLVLGVLMRTRSYSSLLHLASPLPAREMWASSWGVVDIFFYPFKLIPIALPQLSSNLLPGFLGLPGLSLENADLGLLSEGSDQESS